MAVSQQVKRPCIRCGGEGTVYHQKRMINNVVDPSDFQEKEICPRCNGGGAMTDQEIREQDRIAAKAQGG